MTGYASIMQGWLNTLALEQDTPFSLDENGQCAIVANDDRYIILHGPAGSDTFYINIDLMDIPASGAELFFRTALTLNFFQSNTFGAAIAVDERALKLVLSFSSTYSDVEFKQFRRTLSDLLTLSESLIAQLQGLLESDNAQDSMPDQFVSTLGLRI